MRGRDGGQTDRTASGAAASLTFFPHLDVLLAGHVLPPGLLDGPGVAVELALPGLLQQKELQGRTDGRTERSGGTHGEKLTYISAQTQTRMSELNGRNEDT